VSLAASTTAGKLVEGLQCGVQEVGELADIILSLDDFPINSDGAGIVRLCEIVISHIKYLRTLAPLRGASSLMLHQPILSIA
jgi:hypothetical protein